MKFSIAVWYYNFVFEKIFKEYNSLFKEGSRGYGPGLAEHRTLIISEMRRDLPGPQARVHSLRPHCQSTMQEASATKATLSLLRAIPREPHSRVTVKGFTVAMGTEGGCGGRNKNCCNGGRPPETEEPVTPARETLRWSLQTPCSFSGL